MTVFVFPTNLYRFPHTKIEKNHENAKIINFHPSLLPRNRGANPYFWSIFLNWYKELMDNGYISYMNINALQELIDTMAKRSYTDKIENLKLNILDINDILDWIEKSKNEIINKLQNI